MISVMRTLPLLVGMLYLHFEALGVSDNRVAVREQGGGGGVAIRERGGGELCKKMSPWPHHFFPLEHRKHAQFLMLQCGGRVFLMYSQ